MTQLTADTDVFSSAGRTGRCAVAFVARPARPDGIDCGPVIAGIEAVVQSFREGGWHLSLSEMLGDPKPERDGIRHRLCA